MIKAAIMCERETEEVFPESTRKWMGESFDVYDGVFTKENDSLISDVEVLFTTWGVPAYTDEEVRQRFPKLKVLSHAGGTVKHFAKPFLNNGVKVYSAWRENAVAVVEYTVGQILLANKGVQRAARSCRSLAGQNGFTGIDHPYHYKYPGNYGCKVGIVGLGAIGAGVAEKLKQFDLEVLAYDPFASQEKAKALNVRLVSLEELFSTCQTISNHVANCPETVGMFNKQLFDLMKKNATFINSGRGAQVVEADLIEALKEAPDRTAILDITLPFPPQEGSALYTMENVFLTPHIAGSLADEMARLGDCAVEEARRFFAGEPTRYEVTLKMLETMA